MPSFIEKYLWQGLTGLAAITTIALTVLLIKAQVENRVIVADKGKLEERINDPKTGYIAKLAQSHTNEATLSVALDTQNKALDVFKAQSAAQLAVTEHALKVVQAENKDMALKMQHFLAVKPRGATLEERVKDVDARYLETLK